MLVVGVLDSDSPGAMVEESLRLEGVRSISIVSHAFILRDPPESFISRLRPAVVVKGKEHELHENPELAALQEYGGKLLFTSGEITFSSIDLLKREFSRSITRRSPRHGTSPYATVSP